jgi:hypothetical protein
MTDNLQFIRFEKSKNPKKKYTAILKNKDTGREIKKHFGASAYEHYKDSTGLGHWSHKDHLDKTRRKNFRSRFAKASKKKYSPAWFAQKYLW